jgi:hypothetical protein
MATRLIDLPFTSGLNEAVDETVAQLPTMTELTNYRLTRAGRLEHRLGVKDVGLSSVAVSTQGSVPSGNQVQGISGRMLAAGGHGYSLSAGDVWGCAGSLPRFAPVENYPAFQIPTASMSSPSCASALGRLIVAGLRDNSASVPWAGSALVVRIFDELTGQLLYEEPAITVGVGPVRVVTSGNLAVIVYQTSAGTINARSMDLTTLPMVGFSAATSLVGAAVAAAGFDAAPFDATSFLVSYSEGGSAKVSKVTASTLAISATVAEFVGANGLLTTCIGTPGENTYLSWLNTTTRELRVTSIDNSFVKIAAVSVAVVSTTALSNNDFHPVLCRRSSTAAMVGWTSSYVNAGYSTFRTTFRDVSSAAVLGTVHGPMYGVHLASKPFQSASPYYQSDSQPAVLLGNYNPTVTATDRSYFLMLLGSFSRETNNEACSWEMSAAPSGSVGVDLNMSATLQVCEVVESTATGQRCWQTALNQAFRGLGTASPQTMLSVYRFGDGSRSRRAGTRCFVPCQGSFAVLGGAPRFFDGGRLLELGLSSGPVPISLNDNAGGSMAVGTYRYVFVLESYDALGQRSLSYVSSPETVVVGGGNASVDIDILAPPFWAYPNTAAASSVGSARGRDVSLRAYRTSVNSGTVFRYSPSASDPNGVPAGPLLDFGRATYRDTNADADIAANEAIYVQVGNALSNYRAPPCRFGCEHEGRLVVAGCWNPSEFRFSKLFFPGEGIQFTESPAFIGTNPEPITGMASLDGSLVLFGERSIYIVSGDGPTDDGAGSFSTPRKLPGRIGCVDWRSVATREDGVFFRSADGIYMLPRGLGSPVFIGAAIREKLRQYPETLGVATATRAVSASVDDHDSEQVVAWLVGDAEDPAEVAIFMLSLATNSWTQVALPESSGNPQTVIGVWQDITNSSDVIAFARRGLDASVAGSLLAENPGAGYDRDISGSYEPLLAGGWKTGKLFPFGFGGRGSIRSIRIVGECLAATTLAPTIWSDADASGYASTTLTFSPGRFAVEIPFRRRDLAWIQIQVADPTTGSENRGAGLRFNGLALEVEMEPGLHRTTPNQRST